MTSVEFNQLFWALILASLLLLASSITIAVVDPKQYISDVKPTSAPKAAVRPKKPTTKAAPQAGIEEWSKSSQPMSERRKETLKAMVRELNR